MVLEIVPKIVDKYMEEHKDKLILDVEPMINGKMIDSNNIVKAIQDIIVKQLNN